MMFLALYASLVEGGACDPKVPNQNASQDYGPGWSYIPAQPIKAIEIHCGILVEIFREKYLSCTLDLELKDTLLPHKELFLRIKPKEWKEVLSDRDRKKEVVRKRRRRKRRLRRKKKTFELLDVARAQTQDFLVIGNDTFCVVNKLYELGFLPLLVVSQYEQSFLLFASLKVLSNVCSKLHLCHP